MRTSLQALLPRPRGTLSQGSWRATPDPATSRASPSWHERSVSTTLQHAIPLASENKSHREESQVPEAAASTWEAPLRVREGDSRGRVLQQRGSRQSQQVRSCPPAAFIPHLQCFRGVGVIRAEPSTTTFTSQAVNKGLASEGCQHTVVGRDLSYEAGALPLTILVLVYRTLCKVQQPISSGLKSFSKDTQSSQSPI